MPSPEATRKQEIADAITSLVNRLQSLIDDLGYNPASFGAELAVSNSTIGSILRKTSSFNMSILVRIAVVFPRVNMHWLITGMGPMYLSQEENSDNITQTLKAQIAALEQTLQQKDKELGKCTVTNELLTEELNRYQDQLALLKELAFEELANYRRLLNKSEDS